MEEYTHTSNFAMRFVLYKLVFRTNRMSSKPWGPALWKMLHGIAETLGNQSVPMLATDEAHEIVFLLRDVEKIMPCQLCRVHYRAWRTDHPLEEIDKLRGYMLKTGVRQWLYDLHEDVNRSRGIESGLTLEEVEEMYKSTDLKEAWADFFTKVKLTTEVGLVSQSVLQNFHRRYGMLRKIVGRY
jgi:hypothetical protein